MVLAILHHDADGIFSLALLYRKFEEVKPYFTSPVRLKRTLCKVIEENDSENTLYISDLAGNPSLVRLASYFGKVIWVDHHIWDKIEEVNNVKLIIKNSPSATRILAEELGIKDEKLLEIIDFIDTNRKNGKAEFIRDLVGAIKWKYYKDQYLLFDKIAKEISEDIEKVLNSAFYNSLVKSFREWLTENSKDLFSKMRYYRIDDKNCIFFILDKRIPTYYIMDFMEEKINEKFDYIFVIYEGYPIRIEIRTQKNKDVYSIAKELGGGGRKEAAGATVKETDVLEVINKILNILKK